MLLSDSINIELTELLNPAPILNEPSTDKLLFKRIILLKFWPEYCVKSPPITILPSGCLATDRTVLLKYM